MKKLFLNIFILIFIQNISFSQSKGKKREPDTGEAKDNFLMGNFKDALEDYLLLLEKDNSNLVFNYRAGVCYLNTNIDKTKAITYFEFVTQKSPQDELAWFDLGRAFHRCYKFDEAISAFGKYKDIVSKKSFGSSTLIEDADRQIEMCYNAKELVKYPLQVSWENLGKDINTQFPESNPFVDATENILVFNTKRKGTMGGIIDYDGYYTSDIFYSEEQRGGWSKSKTLGSKCNSTGHDEVVSLSSEGDHLFIYTENEVSMGDIYISLKKGKSYQPRLLLDQNINTNQFEIGASIYAESDILFFNSDMAGGHGGFDIYMAKKLPNRQWALPINIGPNVNTKFDEEYPVISPDGKTLYFASRGHASIGGFDIFKSVWDEEKQQFGPAINLGYPINTPDDNFTISYTTNGRHAYLSAYREGGLGDLDIYRLTFSSVEPSFTAIRGVVKTNIPIDYNEYMNFYTYKKNNKSFEFPEAYRPENDTTWVFVEHKKVIIKEGFEYKTMTLFAKKEDPDASLAIPIVLKDGSSQLLKEIKSNLVKKVNYTPLPDDRPLFEQKVIKNVTMFLTDQSNGELYGQYSPIPVSGKYVIIAPPGKYLLTVEADGFKSYSEDVEVLDKGSFKDEIEKDVFLVRNNETSSSPDQNK